MFKPWFKPRYNAQRHVFVCCPGLDPVMRVLILGPARSGTTIFYKLFCLYQPDAVKLYEPFNDGLVLKWRLGLTAALHDSILVDNDLDRLDEETRRLILRNVWFLDYVLGACPFGGPYLREIFERLSKYDRVVVKDVYIWPLLGDEDFVDFLHRHGWLVVAVIRDVNKVVEDLAKWLEREKRLGLTYQGPYVGASVIYSNPLIVFGYQLAHIHIYGKPYPLSVNYSVDDLRRLVHSVYAAYLEILHDLGDRVVVLSHDVLCSNPVSTVREIARLHITSELRGLEHVRC